MSVTKCNECPFTEALRSFVNFLLLNKDLIILNIGDSRVYLFDEGKRQYLFYDGKRLYEGLSVTPAWNLYETIDLINNDLKFIYFDFYGKQEYRKQEYYVRHQNGWMKL